MAGNNNLEDQLNILFDDIEESKPEETPDVQKTNWDFSQLFVQEKEQNRKAAPVKTKAENETEKTASDEPVLDDTDITKDFEDLDFSEVDALIGSEPEIDFSENEEAENETEQAEADDQYLSYHKKIADDDEEAEELHRESVHFWIFTAVVALLVAASVLFILYKRGFIGSDKKKDPSTPAQTSSSEKDTSEKETSSEKSTETQTESDTERESVTENESSSETEDTSSETESSETESSESESPSDSEDTDKEKVLENYDNLFIVSGTGTLNVRKEANAESDLIATIDEFGGGSILEQAGEWYHIRSGGLEGYVKAEFTKTGDEAKQLAVEHTSKRVKITADTLNVRTEADTDADILDVVSKGTVFEMIDETDGFYHVKYNYMYQGYVSKDFSSLDWYLDEAVIYYAE